MFFFRVKLKVHNHPLSDFEKREKIQKIQKVARTRFPLSNEHDRRKKIEES